ncbi:MAG: 6-phosphofructokinase [Lachnospiraceae bacterium]|jgi:6-phosphofructokinase|nr:6-phosphofructokinase [Lachnospiraceae bacterium]MCI8779445.1 6-phosphofructokinase [Lachnospiraceae bacterium]
MIEGKGKIAVLTSGGDAPGMNAAIRAVVRTGITKGYEVYGVRRGYNGILNREIELMTFQDVSEKLQHGGTFLFTARSAEFNEDAGKQKAAAICKELGIDTLVVIGGDGSFKGARDLSKYGVNIIGIPGTIDLDISYTDYTIGFDTAVNTAMEAIDRLRETSNSHERCSVVEVMGRSAGYIALWCGIANGAEAILLQEKFDSETDYDRLINVIRKNREAGMTHQVIINAEGVGHSNSLAKRIEEATGIETRATILGHLQRGGSPTARDRVYASIMGAYAVDIIDQGKKNRLIGYKDDKVYDIDVDEAFQMQKSIDEYQYEVAHILGTRSDYKNN